MFTEVLKISPKLDKKDLSKMERTLNSRFKRVAKKFGKGMGGVFKGGALLGLGLAFVSKILNPLKETQAAIDRTTTSADDVATFATKFETTSGRLFKLIKLAQGAGLSQQALFTVLSKFQTAVASAKLNPLDPTASSVSAFTGESDTAEGFFKFIQALNKTSQSNQSLVQEQIFGAKAGLKIADFLQQDMKALAKVTGVAAVDTAKLTISIEKLEKLNNLSDALAAKRSINDTFTKGQIINRSMIEAKDKAETLKLARENARIKNFQALQAIDNATQKMSILLENAIGMLGGLVQKVTTGMDKITNLLEGFQTSKLMRGIFSFTGKGK